MPCYHEIYVIYALSYQLFGSGEDELWGFAETTPQKVPMKKLNPL